MPKLMSEQASKAFEALRGDPDVFICASTEIKAENNIQNTKLRAYAYGGCMAEIPPVQSNFQVTLLDKEYDKYFEPDFATRVSSARSLKESDKVDLLVEPESRKAIKAGMERWSDGKTFNGESTKSNRERRCEQRIAQRHNSSKNGSNYVVFDMESSIHLKAPDKNAKMDLVAIDAYRYPDVTLAFIEYKCTESGLQNGNSSMASHYNDMSKFATTNTFDTRSEQEIIVLKSLFARFNMMHKLKLIDNCLPDGVEEIDYEQCKVTIKPMILFLCTLDEAKKDISGYLINRAEEMVIQSNPNGESNVRFILADSCDSVIIQDSALLTYGQFIEEAERLKSQRTNRKS